MNEALISNVSDTARWVAAQRAWESRRPDALFRDPFAERLAGSHGEQIARMMPRSTGTANGWPIITRTKLIDDMVLASIGEGCTCVLNLAAGLDTRPYRMHLPADLTWIEADFSAILDEKRQALAGEKPVCTLERVEVDLADPSARSALFDRVGGAHERVLVITEGLVIYLDETLVAALGRDLAARANFALWVLDFPSPAILEMLKKGMGSALANAPMRFAPSNGVAFFEALGWQAADVRSLFHEAGRLKRLPWIMRPFTLLPAPDPRNPKRERWSGVVRLRRRPV